MIISVLVGVTRTSTPEYPSICCDPEPEGKGLNDCRHLLWLRCSADVHLARGHLMHLDTLWEQTSSIFLFHSRYH